MMCQMMNAIASFIIGDQLMVTPPVDDVISSMEMPSKPNKPRKFSNMLKPSSSNLGTVFRRRNHELQPRVNQKQAEQHITRLESSKSNNHTNQSKDSININAPSPSTRLGSRCWRRRGARVGTIARGLQAGGAAATSG